MLPNALYEAIVEREERLSGKADEDRISLFKVGQTVRITDGPFRSFLAKVESMDDRGRVGVLMGIFTRSTPAPLDAIQLEKV